MIDNNVTTTFVNLNGMDRTLKLRNPKLFALCLEYEITNGLGYDPVRKTMKESKSHSQTGLIRHLGNMDYVNLAFDYQIEYLRSKEHFIAFLGFEDAYLDLMKKYNNLLNNVTIFNNRVAENLSKIIDSTPYILKQDILLKKISETSPASKSNGFFKKTFKFVLGIKD